MRRSALFAILVLLVAAVPVGAQGFGNQCTPSGTWYGGADGGPKYLLSVTRQPAGEFAVTFRRGFAVPMPMLTDFSGRLVDRRGDGVYDAYVFALVNFSVAPPPMAPAPDIWAGHGELTLTDCDTLRFHIDFFAGYTGGANWGLKTPFVDPPDYDNLASGPITETYRRMPTP